MPAAKIPRLANCPKDYLLRTRRLAAVLSLALLMTGLVAKLPAQSSPADDYTGTHFGAGNLPPGCVKDMSRSNPANVCYHMRTDMNALDSPQVDVLVLVPVSPTAERDMRIMRQAVEMWEGGIDYLSPQMGMDWLSTGVDFHITVDAIDPTGANGGGGEFTTYPVVDPEIVVIASNPVGGIGIGIDPVNSAISDENVVPCQPVGNPLDFEQWENLPGFDRHHDKREGIYNEDCGGSGGNVCFAINGAIDPAPKTFDIFGLFDLVSHEFGHCMSIGHVGDGAEGAWGKVPTNDIMAYSQDPPGRTKCVSTLDVEGVALRMSKYLDVNGDGAVDTADRLVANDTVGDGRSPFQVQHPRDHLYASDTGSPMRCPQPDLDLVPGQRTDWTPEPAPTTQSTLRVTSPQAGEASDAGVFEVTGTIERRAVAAPTDPPSSGGSGFPLALPSGPTSPLAQQSSTTTFQHDGPNGNTFYPADSGLGFRSGLGDDRSHSFTLDIDTDEPSDVAVALSWADSVGQTDLDLYATTPVGDARSASNNQPEGLTLKNVTGRVQLRVDPYLVTDYDGVPYRLTATVSPTDPGTDGDGDGVTDLNDQCPTKSGPAPSGCPDRDGDGVIDTADACPGVPGAGADGCPIKAVEQVRLYLDGRLVSSQDVDTSGGTDSFSFNRNVPSGEHTLRVDWVRYDKVVATESRTVVALD